MVGGGVLTHELVDEEHGEHWAHYGQNVDNLIGWYGIIVLLHVKHFHRLIHVFGRWLAGYIAAALCDVLLWEFKQAGTSC